MPTTQTIPIDLNTRGANPVAFTHQGDTARAFAFEVYNNGEEFDLTGYTAQIGAILPADRGYTVIAGNDMATGSISENTITATLPAAYTAKAGHGILTIILTGSGGTLRPINIDLRIQKSADSDEVIEGASDFPEGLEEIAESVFQEYLSTYLPPVAPSSSAAANKAADAKLTGEALDDLKSDLGTVTGNAVIDMEEGYIETASSPVDITDVKPSGYYTWRHAVLSCTEGDKFTVSSISGSTPRAWAFLDSSNNVLTSADASAMCKNLLIEAPQNASKLVINDRSTDGRKSYYGELIVDKVLNINRFDCTNILKNGYTGTTGTKIGAFHESANYKTCVLRVTKGDSIYLKGAATDSARTWAFADKDKVITRRAETGTINGVTLTVANGECYFVYNDSATSNPPTTLIVTVNNRFATIQDIAESIDGNTSAIVSTTARVERLENRTASASVKNNLTTDGLDNLTPFNVLVYKNGVEASTNYGVAESRYVLDLGDFDKCHVRFKYRDTVFRPYNGSNIFVPIASLGKNNALNIKELYQSYSYQQGLIYRAGGHYPANKDNGTTLSLSPALKNPINGEIAVIISYNGSAEITSETSIDAVFSSNSVAFSVNGTTIGSVAVNASDTIQAFANSVNNLNGFTCEVVNGNGTVNDLLLLDGDTTVSFITTASRNDMTVYGTRPIAVPFKINKQWHLCEFIVNKTAQEAFVSYDGLTARVGFSSAQQLTDGVLVVGGDYTTESSVEIRNLEVDIGTYADCELINGHITNASTADTRQLISNKNPRLLIFEGHGIFVGSEAEAYQAYQASGSNMSDAGMAVSTERLNIVFNELKSRGYKFVTMKDIIMWKKGLKDLPKRSYTMIFDDYRIENFIDYDKRKPFVKNGATPTLAMVSDLHELSETATINGQSYTISEALDIINRNGWYMCSHTKGHTNISQYTISELLVLLKESVLSCDNHKMHGDVLVYPFGGIDTASLKAVMYSDFALGISIVEEYYNCRATSDYRLTRTELGTRASLDSVLSPFI